MLGQIAFQRQRHGAFLQFLLWFINACQRSQMLPVPVASIHLYEGCVGQKINGALKQVNGVAARCRDAKGEPLVASGGITNKISPKPSQVCVPGLVVLVQPDENRIVVRAAFVQSPRPDAEINEVRVNATAAKIGIDTACAGAGLGQQ